MNCIYKKIRSKKYVKYTYCTLHKKEIINHECNDCSLKIYKEYKPIKSRTPKQIKKEKERFSIIYTELNKCCVCGLKTGDYDDRIKMYTKIQKNEVFEGSYRQKSISLGMITPFCLYCHNQFHKNSLFNLKYKVMFQKEYLKNHTMDDFILNFGQNYEYKLEQKLHQINF